MVQRYQDAMAASSTVTKYKQGIAGVTESPMAKAASPEATDLYLRRVQESVSSGKRQRKLLEAPLQRYKDNATAKADRLASGAKAANDKLRAHFQKWAPIYQSVHDAVQSMPKGTMDAAKQRAGKAIEMLMQAAGRS